MTDFCLNFKTYRKNTNIDVKRQKLFDFAKQIRQEAKYAYGAHTDEYKAFNLKFKEILAETRTLKQIKEATRRLASWGKGVSLDLFLQHAPCSVEDASLAELNLEQAREARVTADGRTQADDSLMENDDDAV